MGVYRTWWVCIPKDHSKMCLCLHCLNLQKKSVLHEIINEYEVGYRENAKDEENVGILQHILTGMLR